MAEGNRLVRAVGRWDLTALAVNGIIGAGIFGLPANAAILTGSWSPLACFLCACIVLMIVLCFAEVGSLFVGTGGPYLYSREAFGDPMGLVGGWMIWLARVTAFAANSNLMISFLGYFLPVVNNVWPRAVGLTLIVAFLTWINVRGVRQGAIVGDILAIAKIIPLLFFVVVGLFFVDWNRLELGSQPAFANMGQAILLYVYAFTGFEYAAIPAGEAVSPKKHLPGALLTALGIAALLYTGIQAVYVGTISGFTHSQTALADASAQFLGAAGGGIIAVAALASIGGNLSGMMLVSPRLTYALAQDGLLPSPLATLHGRYRTPYVSILLFGVLTLGLAVSGTFAGLAQLSAVARIIPYMLTCLALPVLRRKFPSETDRFRLRGGYAIPTVAVALCIWLLAQGKAYDALAAGIALGVGFTLYLATRLWRSKARRLG